MPAHKEKPSHLQDLFGGPQPQGAARGDVSYDRELDLVQGFNEKKDVHKDHDGKHYDPISQQWVDDEKE